MLYSIDSGSYIEKLPHKKAFERWMKQLSDDDYEKIVQTLCVQVDAHDITTAGWIPGNDWSGTVYEPIYHACGKNKTASGLFFGLILFDVLMRREDLVWGFGRFEKDGVPIESTTYFILENPPDL